MTTFILDRSFEEKVDGIRREKVSHEVPTRYGPVFAYQNVFEGRIETVCPGFYMKELSPENSFKEAEIALAAEGLYKLPPARNYRAMDLLGVLEEWRPGVEEDLQLEGYRGEIKW